MVGVAITPPLLASQTDSASATESPGNILSAADAAAAEAAAQVNPEGQKELVKGYAQNVQKLREDAINANKLIISDKQNRWVIEQYNKEVSSIKEGGMFSAATRPIDTTQPAPTAQPAPGQTQTGGWSIRRLD
jgi:hypothetical protein